MPPNTRLAYRLPFERAGALADARADARADALDTVASDAMPLDDDCVAEDAPSRPEDAAHAVGAAPSLGHIGRYALKGVLGEGGLGRVYEAWDPLLSRALAIKTLPLDPTDAAQRELFLHEARAAARLSHRCIVTVHDAGLDGARGCYIAMERLQGRDLRQALDAGWRPTVAEAVRLVRRVAEALACAHAQGVIHCDIKPANIFLQRQGRPMVLDFGLARLARRAAPAALAGAVAGSPRYQAPEQLAGQRIDARADLFALGAVFYELLSRQRAFDGASLGELRAAVLRAAPRPLSQVAPQVPASLAAIVRRLLARDPAARCGSAAELAAELRRWAAEHRPDGGAPQTGAHRVLDAPVAAVPTARAPRWLLGAALVLALAGAATAWWNPRWPQPQIGASAGVAPLVPSVVPSVVPPPTAPTR